MEMQDGAVAGSKTAVRDSAAVHDIEPEHSARAAGLRYVNDKRPGITRKRAGQGFTYKDPNGRTIRDPAELERIKQLAIPPAWTEVWICPLPNGHLQATGRDTRGRKQYRYHPRWREVRDETKYSRMIAFAKALPLIRARVDRDLSLPGLPREKVLALVVRLLESTLIRVGNAEYARDNKSFGLTTMRDRHVNVSGANVRFTFRGKSGKRHTIDFRDKRLAQLVKSCREIPGYELFQYIDDEGQRQDVDSSDVNEYLREVTGTEFTAKDFRTWAGTVLATMALQEFEVFDTKAQAKKNITRAIERVAERLGNTASICRKCYVHPEVMNAYLDGSLIQTLRLRAEEELASALPGLQPEEAATLALLQQRLCREDEHKQQEARAISLGAGAAPELGAG